MVKFSAYKKIVLGFLMILIGVALLLVKPAQAVETKGMSSFNRNARIYTQHCMALDISIDKKYTQQDIWNAKDLPELMTRNPSMRFAPYSVAGKKTWLSCKQAASLVKPDLPTNALEYLYAIDLSEEERAIMVEAGEYNRKEQGGA